MPRYKWRSTYLWNALFTNFCVRHETWARELPFVYYSWFERCTFAQMNKNRLAPAPLTVFHLPCSSLKCAELITKKFCTRHNIITVVTCAKFRCDWLNMLWPLCKTSLNCEFDRNIAMMTSSNGNIPSVTGRLCGEFTDDWWIPRTKASDADLWCFLWSAPE